MDQMLVLKVLIGFTLLTNLAIVVLPLPRVLRLQMDLPNKMAVRLCFGMWFACCIISMVWLYLIFNIGMHTLFCLVGTRLIFPDLIGNVIGTSQIIFVLCTFDLEIACLCNNLITFGPTYSKWFRGWLSVSGYSATRLDRAMELERVLRDIEPPDNRWGLADGSFENDLGLENGKPMPANIPRPKTDDK